MRLLERCGFSLDELKTTEYPDETRQGYATPQEALVAFAEDGARRRYPDEIPAKVRDALNEELRLIGELDYAPYFLTVHEIVRFARDQEHPLPGPRLGGELGRSAIASASPRSIPMQHRPSVRALRLGRAAASRPTSTSISSTSGARR